MLVQVLRHALLRGRLPLLVYVFQKRGTLVFLLPLRAPYSCFRSSRRPDPFLNIQANLLCTTKRVCDDGACAGETPVTDT